MVPRDPETGVPGGSSTGVAVREWPAGYYQTAAWGAPVEFELYEEQRATQQPATQRSRSANSLRRPADDEVPEV